MPKATYSLNEPQREPAQLNWAGQPIRPGESHGGKPEHISDSWSEKLALAAANLLFPLFPESLGAIPNPTNVEHSKESLWLVS
jgi:hypothetical protein